MKIHVVCFQVPYPADYGGAIDVFYKLKALCDVGYDIVLHTYVYGDGRPQAELEKFCSQVIYYHRETGWRRQISFLPYIVGTRRSRQLLDDLCVDDAPILFEGLHTCYFLNYPRLAGRRKIVRMHNIEHEYYRQLARQAGWNWRAIYYYIESVRLRWFERRLRHADLVCAITKADQQSLMRRLPEREVIFLPCFFDATFPDQQADTEPFVLYHGNLSVEENIRAAQFIVRHIAPQCPGVLFVLAGRNPRLDISLPGNVEVVPNPTDEYLDHLLQTARIHLMLTFQSTGIKLKLLNALVRGNGHIIANRPMLYGHSLGRFCVRADEPKDIVENINTLINIPLSLEDKAYKEKILLKMKKAGISRLSLFK